MIPAAGADSTLLADIIHKLDERGEDSTHHDGDTEDGSSVLHVHMYPAECNNVANTMKTLITGFVDRRGTLFFGKQYDEGMI